MRRILESCTRLLLGFALVWTTGCGGRPTTEIPKKPTPVPKEIIDYVARPGGAKGQSSKAAPTPARAETPGTPAGQKK